MLLTGSAGDADHSEPDADLIEYVLVSVAAIDRLESVATTIVDLVDSGAIRLIDAVFLRRLPGQAAVSAQEVGDVDELSRLAAAARDPALMSDHDIELAALTLEPGQSALLLLVEDRWATLLSVAARFAGGGVGAGERVGRSRFLAARGRQGSAGAAQDAPVPRPHPTAGSPSRTGHHDLLARCPAPPASLPSLAVDQAAQLRTLVRLVEQGVLPLEQYEAQRRRVLEG